MKMIEERPSKVRRTQKNDIETILRSSPKGLPFLTESQLIFASNGGPLIAGPGAGKTTTMVWALHYMLLNLDAAVYVLSFTNAACNEFAERIIKGWAGIENHPSWKVWCTKHLRTIHSLAAEICRCFSVFERRRSQIVRVAFQLLKDNFTAASVIFKNWIIIADEGQDSEPVQLSLLAWMARLGSRDALVGDPRQCIFQFAGCRPKEFNAYLESRGHKQEVRENFRSSQEIVNFVNNLVEAEYNFLSVDGKPLKTYLENLSPQIAHKGPNGKVPNVIHIPVLSDHLSSGTNNINEYLRCAIDNPDYSSVACLVRSQRIMDQVHENLSLHPKSMLPCFSWCSQTKLGYTQNLSVDSSMMGNFIQILNVHQAKGQEFDYVLYLVQGYSLVYNLKNTGNKNSKNLQYII